MEISILDVTAVFPEVDDNAISSGQFHQHSCREGIGVVAASGLPQCRDMIDVDPKPWHGASVR